MSFNQPYDLLLHLHQQTGWPTSYKQDLTEYDRVLLDEFKPNTFAWMVRPTGTWLLLLNEVQAFCHLSYSMRYEPHRVFWCRPQVDSTWTGEEISMGTCWDRLYDAACPILGDYVGVRGEFRTAWGMVDMGRVQQRVDEYLKSAA